MPAATDCIFNNKLITVNQAVKKRNLAKKNKSSAPVFLCKGCREEVTALKQSSSGAIAHFEHNRGTNSPNCIYRVRR